MKTRRNTRSAARLAVADRRGREFSTVEDVLFAPSGHDHYGPEVVAPASSISERRSVIVLAGAGLTPRLARKVLHAGLAGPAVALPGMTLYDEARVHALLDWPEVTLDDCSEVCPQGVLVLRREVSVLQPPEAQLEAVSSGWDIAEWTRLRLRVRCAREGGPRAPYPAVVTVGGFVAAGADVAHLGPRPRLGLVRPGEWFGRFVGRRLPAGPGKAWFLLGEPRSILGVDERGVRGASGRGDGPRRVGESGA